MDGWCADVFTGRSTWTGKDSRTVLVSEGMDDTEMFVCGALAFAADAEGKFEEWTDVKEVLEGLTAPTNGSIECKDYRFADGFYFDGEDSCSKACDHEEEEHDIVDCKYCPLECQRVYL